MTLISFSQVSKLYQAIHWLKWASDQGSDFNRRYVEPCHCNWEFVVHENNYSLDCMAGEDEGKSGYFQCAVHLPVDT